MRIYSTDDKTNDDSMPKYGIQPLAIHGPPTNTGIIYIDAAFVTTEAPRQVIVQSANAPFDVWLPNPADIVSHLDPDTAVGTRVVFSVLNRTAHNVTFRAPTGVTIHAGGTVALPLQQNTLVNVLLSVTSIQAGNMTMDVTNLH